MEGNPEAEQDGEIMSHLTLEHLVIPWEELESREPRQFLLHHIL